ncbi:hypothetical protein H696_03894 [Fonticula alba]|uniref:Rubisco LSMT substrate-binding domain-containing protein n=1 Tax=Fonticula alba TaxID=691883 RepID=A0A058Z5F9_FONAL|nr:hypothetical protein H696_03894 [Fonticula alba]KCV69465.1 hypothetical protein H696_03894 [Fonticula alba]|eukprot:XP_009496030.1 hypothetical protein H696_03894 [Fonticula alba]
MELVLPPISPADPLGSIWARTLLISGTGDSDDPSGSFVARLQQLGQKLGVPLEAPIRLATEDPMPDNLVTLARFLSLWEFEEYFIEDWTPASGPISPRNELFALTSLQAYLQWCRVQLGADGGLTPAADTLLTMAMDRVMALLAMQRPDAGPGLAAGQPATQPTLRQIAQTLGVTGGTAPGQAPLAENLAHAAVDAEGHLMGLRTDPTGAGLAPGVEAILVPRSAMMTVAAGRETPGIGRVLCEVEGLDEVTQLVLLVLHETFVRGADSRWHAYLDALPRHIPSLIACGFVADCPNTPAGQAAKATAMQYRTRLDAELAETSVLLEAQQVRSELERVHGLLFPALSDYYTEELPAAACTLDRFIWARAVIDSRAMTMRLGSEEQAIPPGGAGQSALDVGITFGTLGMCASILHSPEALAQPEVTCLVPGADLANHALRSHISRRWFDPVRQAVVFYSHFPVAPGDELTYYYSPVSNRTGLLQFGFVLDGPASSSAPAPLSRANPYDVVGVVLGAPDHDGLADLRIRQLLRRPYCGGIDHCVRLGLGPWIQDAFCQDAHLGVEGPGAAARLFGSLTGIEHLADLVNAEANLPRPSAAECPIVDVLRAPVSPRLLNAMRVLLADRPQLNQLMRLGSTFGSVDPTAAPTRATCAEDDSRALGAEHELFILCSLEDILLDLLQAYPTTLAADLDMLAGLTGGAMSLAGPEAGALHLALRYRIGEKRALASALAWTRHNVALLRATLAAILGDSPAVAMAGTRREKHLLNRHARGTAALARPGRQINRRLAEEREQQDDHQSANRPAGREDPRADRARQ